MCVCVCVCELSILTVLMHVGFCVRAGSLFITSREEANSHIQGAYDAINGSLVVSIGSKQGAGETASAEGVAEDTAPWQLQLHRLHCVAGDLRIQNNSNALNMSHAFPALGGVGGSLDIAGDQGVLAPASFAALAWVGQRLIVQKSPDLTSMGGWFPRLGSVGQDMSKSKLRLINNNPPPAGWLADDGGFISNLEESVVIDSNANLVDVGGAFAALYEVGGGIVVKDNPRLPAVDADAFPALRVARGGVIVAYNGGLVSMQGCFPKLEDVRYLVVQGNGRTPIPLYLSTKQCRPRADPVANTGDTYICPKDYTCEGYTAAASWGKCVDRTSSRPLSIARAFASLRIVSNVLRFGGQGEDIVGFGGAFERLQTVVRMSIHGNSRLTSLSHAFPAVKLVQHGVDISSNGMLASLDGAFPLLEFITLDLRLEGLRAIAINSTFMPRLRHIQGGLLFRNNTHLVQLPAFPSLTRAHHVTVDTPSPSAFALGGFLTAAEHVDSIVITNCPVLGLDRGFPSLVAVNHLSIVAGFSALHGAFPRLRHVGRLVMVSEHLLNMQSAFPSLVTVGGDVAARFDVKNAAGNYNVNILGLDGCDDAFENLDPARSTALYRAVRAIKTAIGCPPAAGADVCSCANPAACSSAHSGTLLLDSEYAVAAANQGPQVYTDAGQGVCTDMDGNAVSDQHGKNTSNAACKQRCDDLGARCQAYLPDIMTGGCFNYVTVFVDEPGWVNTRAYGDAHKMSKAVMPRLPNPSHCYVKPRGYRQAYQIVKDVVVVALDGTEDLSLKSIKCITGDISIQSNKVDLTGAFSALRQVQGSFVMINSEASTLAAGFQQLEAVSGKMHFSLNTGWKHGVRQSSSPVPHMSARTPTDT